jgi:acyl carrier protein
VEIQRDIKRFIQEELKRDAEAVSDTDSLLEAGVLDSVAVLQLVAFVERQYGIVVTDDEMMPEHFETVAAIAAFVQRRQGTARA